VQLRQLIALHCRDPVGEAIAAQIAHDLGERGDMAGERLQVCAARQHLLALGLLVDI
jgi:hypothetical protein